VVTDGTNGIGGSGIPAQFKLEAVTSGTLGQTLPAGARSASRHPAPATPVPAPVGSFDLPLYHNNTAELASGKNRDFERRRRRLADGDFAPPADQFATCNQTYQAGVGPRPICGRRCLTDLGDSAKLSGLSRALAPIPTARCAAERCTSLADPFGALGQTQKPAFTLRPKSRPFPNEPLRRPSPKPNAACLPASDLMTVGWRKRSPPALTPRPPPLVGGVRGRRFNPLLIC